MWRYHYLAVWFPVWRQAQSLRTKFLWNVDSAKALLSSMCSPAHPSGWTEWLKNFLSMYAYTLPPSLWFPSFWFFYFPAFDSLISIKETMILFCRYAPPHPQGIWPLTANILDPVSWICSWKQRVKYRQLSMGPLQFVKGPLQTIPVLFVINILCCDILG